jgi:membrane-bound ClpP family serine protease
MTDYTTIVVTMILILIIVLVMMARMFYTIQAGQIGLVFILGAYRGVATTGLNVVSPLAHVVKVTPGSGANNALALLGVAESELGPDLPPGRVRIGDRIVAARSAAPVSVGVKVRVIQDNSPGIVLVTRERRRFERPAQPLRS